MVRPCRLQSRAVKLRDLLGEFRLQGISSAPRRVAKLKVCFDIDADGILKVSAEEESKAGGVKNEMTITSSKGRLSTIQIKKKVQEAEECKREDELHRNKVKALYAFEDFAYKMRDEGNAAKLETADEMKIQEAFDSAIKWLESNKFDALQNKKKELEKIYDTIMPK